MIKKVAQSCVKNSFCERPLKKFRKGKKRQKKFLERIQVYAEPKFRNLTGDQQDFLDRKGRYAPYWPVRTAEVEEEQDEEYGEEGEEEG